MCYGGGQKITTYITHIKEFAYGNYFGDRESAEKDFRRRVEELRQDYGLPPKPRKPPGHDDMAR